MVRKIKMTYLVTDPDSNMFGDIVTIRSIEDEIYEVVSDTDGTIGHLVETQLQFIL